MIVQVHCTKNKCCWQFRIILSNALNIFVHLHVHSKMQKTAKTISFPEHARLRTRACPGNEIIRSVRRYYFRQQVGNSREHAQNPCGLSGLIELEGKMAEFYVTE